MSVRQSTELVQTFAPDLDEVGGLIDLGMIPGLEVACDCEWCPDKDVWKLIPDDGNAVMCGLCMMPINMTFDDGTDMPLDTQDLHINLNENG